MSLNRNQTPRNMTCRQFLDMFIDIAQKHHQLNGVFTLGSIDDIDIQKLNLTAFPFLHVSLLPVTIDTQTMTYSFEIIVADQTQIDNIIDRSGGGVLATSPEGDAHSYTLNIIKDIIANFRQSINANSYASPHADIQFPITAEPFRAKFANLLVGWTASLSVTCQNTNNLCDVPQTPNP
jgi:hypothetical protein